MYTHKLNYSVTNPLLKHLNEVHNNFNILIEGDSMTRQIPVQNSLSISTSGLRLQELAYRYSFQSPTDENRIYNPDVIFILIGTNNVSTNTDIDEARDIFQNLCRELRNHHAQMMDKVVKKCRVSFLETHILLKH
jgi:hypothetical protein